MSSIPLGVKMPEPPKYSRSLVHLAVRPQRLAFILDAALGKNDLLEIVEYNTSVWGGFYNLMVPSQQGVITSDYLAALHRYDPDRIVFCGNIPEALCGHIVTLIEPFTAFTLETIKQDKLIKHDRAYPIHTWQPFRRAIENLAHKETSVVRFLNIASDHELYLHALTQFGFLESKGQIVLKQDMKAQEIVLAKEQTLGEYLATLCDGLQNDYPICLTQAALRISSSSGTPSDVVVVLSDDSSLTEAFAAFWNWRMDAGRSVMPSHDDILFLPIELFQKKHNISALAQWCLERHNCGRIMLVGASSLKKRAATLKKRLEPLVRPKFNTISFISDASYMVASKIVNNEVSEEVSWNNDKTRIRVPKPSFDRSWLRRDDAWVVECDIEDPSVNRYGFYPPRGRGQKKLLNDVINGERRIYSVAGNLWRLYKGKLCFQANSRLDYVDLRLPSTEQVFENVFQSHDYSNRRSDKADYIAASHALLDQADFTKHFRDKAYRDLFYSMENGEALKKSAMLQCLKLSQQQQPGFPSLLLDLLRAGCLHRGCLCRCPACGMKNWYPVDEQDEFMACQGCKCIFQFPLDCAHSYRLSSLLATCVEQGGIPVILTEVVLNNLAKKAYMSIPGLKLSPGEHDIDIAAVIDGRLVFAECKTLYELKSQRKPKEIMAQLENDHAMAKDIGADIFCVSVMTDKPYQSLLNFVTKKNKMHTAPLTIMLTLKDLEKGWLTTAPVLKQMPNNNGESRLWINELLSLGHENGFIVNR